MLRGFDGLTAIEVSFWALLQPAWLPTVTVVSPTIWSTFGAGFRYGLGLATKSWQSAEMFGPSSPSPSSSSARTSLSSGLGTRCLATSALLATLGRAASTDAGPVAGPVDAEAGWPSAISAAAVSRPAASMPARRGRRLMAGSPLRR